MAKTVNHKTTSYEKVLVSLPRSLAEELKKYATIVRGGNKSGFVADAVEAYIKAMRRHRHTEKLRQSYAASAEHSVAIAQEWEHLDEETWSQLDKLAAGGK